MCLMNYSLQHDFIMLLLPICLSPPSLQKLLLYCITRSLKVLHRVAWHDSNPWLCIRSYLMMNTLLKTGFVEYTGNCLHKEISEWRSVVFFNQSFLLICKNKKRAKPREKDRFDEIVQLFKSK